MKQDVARLKTIHTVWYAGTMQRYIPHRYHYVAMVTTCCHGYYHVVTRNESLVTHSNGPCAYTSILCSEPLTGTHAIFLHTSSRLYFISARGRSLAMYVYSPLLLLPRQFHSSQTSHPQTLCYSCNPASKEGGVSVTYSMHVHLLYPQWVDSTGPSSLRACLVLPACMHMYVAH